MSKLGWRMALCVLVLSGALAGRANAQWVYVGSWAVSDGPIWTSNPLAMSGQMTAAFLFGGAPSNYAISTNGNNPSLINFETWLDGWGDTRYLIGGNPGLPAPENYYLSSNGGGYNQYPSFSAYVYDHACAPGGPYCDPGNSQNDINYAFRQVTPEPASVLLLMTGLLGLGGVTFLRRRFA
jgi:hypothetical protein